MNNGKAMDGPGKRLIPYIAKNYINRKAKSAWLTKTIKTALKPLKNAYFQGF